MRRMRDFSFGHYVAVGVPVLAVALGINHLVRHHSAGTSGKEVATAMKPSEYKQESTKSTRKIASASANGVVNHRNEEDDADDRDEPAATDRHAANHVTSPEEHERGVTLEGAVNDALAAGTECTSIEYRGDGPTATKVTRGEWITVMDQFHAAKHELLGWLEKNRHELPEATAQAMEKQVRNLKIQRPPASEEPDLSWRGIGIYTQNAEGEPILKLGGGFVRLAGTHPARARFEMARLVAQSWAPCELTRVSAADATWSPLLKCLGVNESQGCGQGTYSEGGWAVSTTLAAAVSPPGCRIPAFKTPDTGKCVSHVPFSTMAAQGSAVPLVAARAIASGSAHSPTSSTEGGRQ